MVMMVIMRPFFIMMAMLWVISQAQVINHLAKVLMYNVDDHGYEDEIKTKTMTKTQRHNNQSLLQTSSWLTATQPKLTKCSTNMNYGSYVTALVPQCHHLYIENGRGPNRLRHKKRQNLQIN